ncbi:hypothetical protein [Nonomuraea sp. NPDC050691]|uniref:hypothetical protein n=1 Tax=Nonomuraea sp. NPDC050691 TaxID=3155661 RepID=UPI00340068C3
MTTVGPYQTDGGELLPLAPSLVSPQAWGRGVIVAATSILTLAFARRAQHAGHRALLRLRIVLVVIPVAVVGVLLFLPLPGWMVAEQGVCGLLLLSAAVLAFRVSPAPANRQGAAEDPTQGTS